MITGRTGLHSVLLLLLILDWDLKFYFSTFVQMKSHFFTIFFVIIWIVNISQINACPPGAPPESCKIYEVGRRRIQFRVCGGVLRSYFGYACGYRKRRKRNGKEHAVSLSKFFFLFNRPFSYSPVSVLDWN